MHVQNNAHRNRYFISFMSRSPVDVVCLVILESSDGPPPSVAVKEKSSAETEGLPIWRLWWIKDSGEK